MTKIDIINKVMTLGFTKQNATGIIESMLTCIKEALINQEKIQLKNFGYFEVRLKHSRLGINPQTKEKMTIVGKKTPVFRPSKYLKEKVNMK